jgi:hypothetical protein
MSSENDGQRMRSHLGRMERGKSSIIGRLYEEFTLDGDNEARSAAAERRRSADGRAQ